MVAIGDIKVDFSDSNNVYKAYPKSATQNPPDDARRGAGSAPVGPEPRTVLPPAG